mmetsp:Transcript_38982/g.62822  ORF Transcript_38982/g.62822 Transcript_38982/m.62822 type:complete len:93 (-) Transcript_38982:733-1011(-)
MALLVVGGLKKQGRVELRIAFLRTEIQSMQSKMQTMTMDSPICWLELQRAKLKGREGKKKKSQVLLAAFLADSSFVQKLSRLWHEPLVHEKR